MGVGVGSLLLDLLRRKLIGSSYTAVRYCYCFVDNKSWYDIPEEESILVPVGVHNELTYESSAHSLKLVKT